MPANKAIYQNNIKIASGVQSCKFSETNESGKQAITVSITIKGNKESSAQVRTTTYVLNN